MTENNTPPPSSTGFSFGSESILPSSLRRRPSSPSAGGSGNANGEQSRNQSSDIKKATDEALKHRQTLAKQLEVIFSSYFICD